MVTGLAPDEFVIVFDKYGHQQTQDSRLGSRSIKEPLKRRAADEQALTRASNGEIKSLYTKCRTENCVRSKIRSSDLAEKLPIICRCLSYLVKREITLTKFISSFPLVLDNVLLSISSVLE